MKPRGNCERMLDAGKEAYDQRMLDRAKKKKEDAARRSREFRARGAKTVGREVGKTGRPRLRAEGRGTDRGRATWWQKDRETGEEGGARRKGYFSMIR